MRTPSIPVVAAALAALSAPAAADTFKAPSEAFPTIQSAVDAAEEGDTVLVLKGNHDEVVSLVGRTNVTIRGQRGGSVRGLTFVNSPCRVRNLTVDGAGSGGNGIEATDSPGLELRAVTVTNFGGHGVSLDGCDGARIEKVTISGIGGDGIHDENSDDLVIEKSILDDIDGDALDLSTGNASGQGSDRAVISGCRIANAGNGIAIAGSDFEVEKNRMEGIPGAGILVDDSTGGMNGLAAKNRIEGTGTFLIVDEANYTELQKNRLSGGGIFSSGMGSWTEGNTVENAEDGVRLVGDYAFCVKNTVRECGTGFLLEGDGCYLERDRTSGCGTGIDVTGASEVINDCAFRSSVDYGALVRSAGNTFDHTSARGSGTLDLADMQAEGANNYIHGNFPSAEFGFHFF